MRSVFILAYISIGLLMCDGQDDLLSELCRLADNDNTGSLAVDAQSSTDHSDTDEPMVPVDTHAASENLFEESVDLFGDFENDNAYMDGGHIGGDTVPVDAHIDDSLAIIAATAVANAVPQP